MRENAPLMGTGTMRSCETELGSTFKIFGFGPCFLSFLSKCINIQKKICIHLYVYIRVVYNLT